MNYKSGVTLGTKYRDSITGFEGTAEAVFFFANGCIRVNLEAADTNSDGQVVGIKHYIFDEQRLLVASTGRPINSEAKVGGGRTKPKAPKADIESSLTARESVMSIRR